MYNDELMHFGIKGMKWGVRRKYYNKDGSLNTSGKQKELLRKYKADRKAANSREEKKAIKAQYKKDVDNTYNKKYDSISRASDKYNYGTSTVNKINDRMNAGQSYKKALAIEGTKTMAKNVAISTALLATPYIANATVNSISKYANVKVQQRANASLAKIGTLQYEKVAGDIYRQVMR